MPEEQVSFSEEDLKELTEAFITKGGTLKDVRGMSDKDMEAIYTLGHGFYNSGKYEDALNAFKFLTFYDHLEKRWWMGLGATRQMMEDFEGAVMAYSYTAMLNVEDPLPHLHAAECLLALEKYEEADSALSATVHWAGDQPEHVETKARAETMLQIVQSKQKESEGS